MLRKNAMSFVVCFISIQKSTADELSNDYLLQHIVYSRVRTSARKQALRK
jgi:hypothetical protein